MNNRVLNNIFKAMLALVALGFVIETSAKEKLFETVGPPNTDNLPAHVVRTQSVQINRRALQSPSLIIDLYGEQLIAERDRIERHKTGQLVWVGHLLGHPGNTVIVTLRGNAVSALIQSDSSSYRIGVDSRGQKQLYEIDLGSLPPDDADDLPEGNSTMAEETAADAVSQDLLVVYNQVACDYVDLTDCDALEADIVTAVADINTAYAQSGIDITLNLVGMALTQYTGTNASQALSDLRGTSDGQIDEA